jgi:hypothetical protein
MNLLQNFEKECPSYVEMIWDELKEAVWYFFQYCFLMLI